MEPFVTNAFDVGGSRSYTAPARARRNATPSGLCPKRTARVSLATPEAELSFVR
jgi:hypothetical protein